MRDLKVIGLEDGALVASTEDGERFRIVIDEVLQSHVRRNRQEPYNGPKLSPREVQAHIRGGLSAADVAQLTGAPLEYIQRYEGPVLAEREHVVSAALGVAVLTASEPHESADATFGTAILDRLAGLHATNAEWTSWKEEAGGWVVKLSFSAQEVDHDARWSFEPKKLALAPLNSEAVTLSKQGEMPDALIPRLRAVEKDSTEPDASRFDSGAFAFTEDEKGPRLELTNVSRPQSSAKAAAAAINRGDDATSHAPSNQTADLLEALRKRRGERESSSPVDGRDTLRGIRPVDVPLANFDELETATPPAEDNSSTSRPAKKGRTAMPSWDEIVFGARTDDD